MDVKDVSEESKFVDFLRQIQGAAERAGRRKGQAVRDHPPPEQIVSNFTRKATSTSYVSQSHEKLITTSQVPAPYPPCVVSANSLEPILISDMRLETHHRGKKTTLRVLTPPDRMTAVMAIVEDEKGTAILLQLYHQPEEAVVPAVEILSPGKICILKEPFFKCATDGSYSLRVDHPSDLLWLDEAGERTPTIWRSSDIASHFDSTGTRKKGNEAVQAKKWAEALRLYSSAIQQGKTSEERRLALLNRSFANLNLGRPRAALLDAVQAVDPTVPSEKSLFREARALYELGSYEECLEKLKGLVRSFPGNTAANTEKKRVQERLNEQRVGNYSFTRMYHKAEQSPPFIDCATFSAPVEIRESSGRGRGLFTTRAVSAGELLLCEKAFCYSFAGDRQSTHQTSILMNLTTKKMVIGGQARLLSLIVQKLCHNPALSAAFAELHHADCRRVPVGECDGVPIVDSFLVEKIISLNAFGSPRSSRESFLSEVSGSSDMTSSERSNFTTTGMWLLASRINHACVGNCRRSFIGDMQIIRATSDLPAHTELLFCYREPVPFESYQDVQRGLKHWRFTCDCKLCMSRKATPKSIVQRRKTLVNDLQKLVGNFDSSRILEAQRLIHSLEDTYPKTNESAVRLELWQPCFALSSYFLANYQLKDAAELIIKGLEALGYRIIASPPSETTDKPRLEVERWGIANFSVPWAFYNLLKVYQQLAPELCSRAENYTWLSYSMVVGEKETCSAIFPRPV